jgi:hypothetical protein
MFVSSSVRGSHDTPPLWGNYVFLRNFPKSGGYAKTAKSGIPVMNYLALYEIGIIPTS